MQNCKACQHFLHDYIHHNLHTTGLLRPVGNMKQIKEQIHPLIHTTLRSINTVTEWVLRSMKGEVEMRTTLIKKPDTKEEEYLLAYLILKSVGSGFREKVKDAEQTVVLHDMVRFRRTDKSDSRKDIFLAILIIPILEELISLHEDHSRPHTAEYFSAPRPNKNLDEYDLLYS
jgi:hypothetical protein